jgi:hypothetical protein
MPTAHLTDSGEIARVLVEHGVRSNWPNTATSKFGLHTCGWIASI